MTAKEYLKQTFTLDKQIKSKQEQIRQLRDMQMNISNVLQPDRVQTSRETHKTADLSDSILDLIDEYAKDVTQLLRLKHDIKLAVEKVPDKTLKTVLEWRYINMATWEKIAVEMEYTYQWVCSLHGDALKKLEELIEVDSLDVL